MRHRREGNRPKTTHTQATSAGISLAREFIGRGRRVALLESGGIEPNARVQALADGPTFGDIKPSVEVNRGQFGGNAKVWCIGLGHVGWPLRRGDLMAAYARAQQVCAGGLFDYQPGHWEDDKARQLPLHGQGVETGMFDFSPFEVFTRDYRRQLFAAPNITVYTHATAMELLARDDLGGVASVRISGPGQRPWVLHERNVVLAAGGYANPTLTLVALALRLADHLKAQPHLKAALPRTSRAYRPATGSLPV